MLLELPQSLLNVTVELAVDFGAAQADVNTNEPYEYQTSRELWVKHSLMLAMEGFANNLICI